MKYLAAVLFLLLFPIQAYAAREFEVIDFKEDPLDMSAQIEQIKDMNADICSFLRVESDVEGELYLTDIQVYERVKKSSGVFGFYISFRERNITFTSPGYMPHRYRIPVQLEKGKSYVVRLRSTGDENGEGRGNIRIETDPPGARIIFNNLPVPELSPCTIKDQKVGSHLILIEKAGFDSIETTVEVEKDQTVTRKFTLSRQYARLKVTSDPSGATIYLDGDVIGTTPLERSDLTPGESTIIVSKEGYEPNSQQIRLIASQLKTIHVDLFLMMGSVSITTNPTGADVWLDGQSVGKYQGTPIIKNKLTLGKHTARAALEGYEDATSNFTVEYNKKTPVELNLRANPGAIFVMTTPSGADIYLDDINTGQKSPFKLENISAGEHTLRLTLQGYGDVVKKIIVEPGEPLTINETLSETIESRLAESDLRDNVIFEKEKTDTVRIVKIEKGIQILKFGKIKNTHFYGIALPIISGSGRYEKFTGIDIGYFFAPFIGFSANDAVSQFNGLAYGGWASVAVNFTGVQISPVNYTINKHEIMQLGIVNYAHKINGIQIGLLNYTSYLKGVQLGGICIVTRSTQLPIMIGINIGW